MATAALVAFRLQRIGVVFALLQLGAAFGDSLRSDTLAEGDQRAASSPCFLSASGLALLVHQERLVCRTFLKQTRMVRRRSVPHDRRMQRSEPSQSSCFRSISAGRPHEIQYSRSLGSVVLIVSTSNDGSASGEIAFMFSVAEGAFCCAVADGPQMQAATTAIVVTIRITSAPSVSPNVCAVRLQSSCVPVR